jgi:TBC1 domain family member 5
MRAPDGSYEEGFQIPGDSTPTPAAPRKPDNWNLNNPLSLDSSNPWHAYFSALESQNTIRQDVERTFPEIPYFRTTAVQTEMTHILFLHASERENVGYRQGMHELLACVYRAVDFDSVERSYSSQVNSQLQELCDRTYVAADAYTLFGAIMQRMESWYEWRAPIPEPIPPASPMPHVPHISAKSEMVPPLKQHVNILANGQLDLRQYVAPIIPTCTSLRDEKLRVVDPHLWEKLHDIGVEPQMYGM